MRYKKAQKDVKNMAKSMTGYGRAQATVSDIDVTVEIKSVNHRHLEFSPRVPRGCTFMEERLKALVSSRVARGKVDMFVTVNTAALGQTEIVINKPFAEAYISALKQLSKDYKLKYDVTVSSVAKNPEIFEIVKKEIDEDTLWDAVSQVANSAINNFIEMRAVEGKKLTEDILSRVKKIEEKVSFIEVRSPETVKEYREKLEQRMKDLLGDVNVDEQRLLIETGIIADKLAVSEETVRLRSHMSQLTQLINGDTSVGRNLDFIVQEMNREANTIGSKAQDIEINQSVVAIKTEIEKIREQVQNIE